MWFLALVLVIGVFGYDEGERVAWTLINFGNEEEDRAVWKKWKIEYSREYAPELEEKRFGIFQTNLRDYEYRTAHDTAMFGPDMYADLTKNEFKALFAPDMGGAMPEDCLQSGRNSTHTEDEIKTIIQANGGDDIDWRTKGAVTPVKNQGQYGSCWAFGATGTMEGMSVAQSKLALESVSEQELIDCSPCGGYVGCCLSWYVSDTKGQPNTEASYPYKGRKGSCQKDSAKICKMAVKDRVCDANGAKNNQDNVLADLIKYGPGACLIDASCISGYKSGIISNCPIKAGNIDHATLFVGAGTDGGVPYWIVKNSWGSSFGDKGYYKMKRNTDPPQAGVPGGIFGVAP